MHGVIRVAASTHIPSGPCHRPDQTSPQKQRCGLGLVLPGVGNFGNRAQLPSSLGFPPEGVAPPTVMVQPRFTVIPCFSMQELRLVIANIAIIAETGW